MGRALTRVNKANKPFKETNKPQAEEPQKLKLVKLSAEDEHSTKIKFIKDLPTTTKTLQAVLSKQTDDTARSVVV